MSFSRWIEKKLDCNGLFIRIKVKESFWKYVHMWVERQSSCLCVSFLFRHWTLLTCLMYGYGRLLPQSNQSRMNREKSLLSAKAIYLCAYSFMLWQQSFFPNQKYRKHKCHNQKQILWLFDGYMREKCFFYWIIICWKKTSSIPETKPPIIHWN